MISTLIAKHGALLDAALAAIHTRGYWAAFNESPSPKAYGEGAPEAGLAAYQAHLGQRFALDQAGQTGWLAPERSPYGVALDVSYPVCSPAALIAAAQAATPAWQAVGPEGRAAVCAEMLVRLNACSFEIAHAVMMTTGQAWMMAFQAGGPHAQDRGLEALAWALREQRFVPAQAHWEKPQGKNPPLVLQKHFELVGRGLAVAVGCATFPTWNTYPGLFAALATGNPVIVKPHEAAVLPAAITVRVLRQVLSDCGLDPNLVSLCVTDQPEVTQALVTDPAVAMVDFTGGPVFGSWLRENCRQADVYAELAGINCVVIDSTDDYAGLLRNLAFTLSLYAGQMCTTSQALLVAAGGIDTDQGHKSFDALAADLAAAIDKLLTKPEVACAVLGAVQSAATLARIQQANAGALGRVVRASSHIAHPDYPQAQVHTPALLACEASDTAAYQTERFGPISFLVRCADTAQAIAIALQTMHSHGALTASLYSRDAARVSTMAAACLQARVALSVNLTGGVFVNQSAAYSDFHASGGNPAANASYADAAFVARRFCVVQRRWHV